MEDRGDDDWSVDRDALRELTRARRDGPGLARLLVTCALCFGGGALTVALARAGDPRWLVTVALSAIGVAGLFPALHEAGHKTAFRSARLNELTAWLGATMMLQAPSFFREFHWQHHRATQDRALDPEISMAPELLDDWPRRPWEYLALVSGQGLMVGKLMFTLSCAVMPGWAMSSWARLFPFIRADRRRRVAWESRLVIALLAALLLAARVVPGLGYALLAWPLAHLLLGFYLMPEHTGLGGAGSQLQRTRTVRSNALVRWLMWNMPYHAEHHAYPGVPFHSLPALHRRLAPALVHVERGYITFHLRAIRTALGR